MFKKHPHLVPQQEVWLTGRALTLSLIPRSRISKKTKLLILPVVVVLFLFLFFFTLQHLPPPQETSYPILLIWGYSPTDPPTPASPPWHSSTRGIDPSQDQGPLPLMPDKAILFYISDWSHGSLHVYSLVGGLVPGSTLGSGWLLLFFNQPELQTPSTPSVLSLTPLLGTPVLSPMDGCEHPPLYLSDTGKGLSGGSYIMLLSASTSWHPQ
jgi:hypothetical protein